MQSGLFIFELNTQGKATMSYIKVQCNECEKVHQINQADFDFEEVDSDERKMGAEITYGGTLEISCDCGHSIEITHHFWEYAGSETNKETEVSGASVIENKL